MSAIVWWVIPAVSVLVAIAWVAWISRERPRADPQESVESYHRFQQAMARDQVRRAKGSPVRGGAEQDPSDQGPAEPGGPAGHHRRPPSGS